MRTGSLAEEEKIQLVHLLLHLGVYMESFLSWLVKLNVQIVYVFVSAFTTRVHSTLPWFAGCKLVRQCK